MNDKTINVGLTPRELMDLFIRLGLIVLLVILCFRVFSPFLGLMLWALVLAVTLYPLHQRLANRMGGRQGRAATVFVVAGLFLIGAPVVMLSTSAAEHMTSIYQSYEEGSLVIPPPSAKVAEWPLIGARVYTAWDADQK